MFNVKFCEKSRVDKKYPQLVFWKTIILSGKSRCSVCIKITHERNEGIKKLAKTTIVCSKCNNFVCGRHSVKTNVCLSCTANNTDEDSDIE